MSGQLVNFEKSALTFNPNAFSGTIQAIQRIFSINAVRGCDLCQAIKVDRGYIREWLPSQLVGCSKKRLVVATTVTNSRPAGDHHV